MGLEALTQASRPPQDRARRCWLSVEPFEERLTPSTGKMFVAGGPFYAFQYQTVSVSVDLTASGAATLDEFDIAMSYDPTQLFVAPSGAFNGPQSGEGKFTS